MAEVTTKAAERESGLVFDIQRFSIHDGPGIRTTVFLKGCPLRCLWCSNPESQHPSPALFVREVKCHRCGACSEACPERCITMDPEEGRRIVDWSRCTQCLACVEACRYGSLVVSGRRLDVRAIVDEVLKDRVFYETSGGGITISGGEPLAQADALASLLRTAKEEGLHTVLDTSGCAPWCRFEAVLPYVDLVLFDVKHLDPARHEAATGVDNRIILENLENLRGRVPLWIRVPLIAGFNDAERHVELVADLAARVEADRVSLLPYHEGGVSKCAQIGKSYALPTGQKPSDDHLERLAGIVKARGLKVVVAA